MSFKDRTNKSLIRLFYAFAKPVNIIYTKIIAGVDIAHPSTTEELILTNSGELIKGFFVSPEAILNDKGVVSKFDGELVIDDIEFNPQSLSFSKGVYTDIQSKELIVNDVTVNTTEIINLDTLLIELNKIDNIIAYAVDVNNFVIISTVKDETSDIAYKDLTITGEAGTDLGLALKSSKSTAKVKVNGITYSIDSVISGDFVKTLNLKRG